MPKRGLFTVTLLLLGALLLSACSMSLPARVQNLLPGVQTEPTAVPAPTEAPAEEAAPPANSLPSLAAAVEGALTQIYNQVNPSVVNIQVVQGVSNAMPENMPGLPFQNPENMIPRQGVGSGFVWDKDGHIVTNNHVVDGATDIRVTFSDGSTVQATVVGTDPDSDLAVVKVDVAASKLTPVQVADSSQVQVGDLAIAIGNPFALQGTMTAGIISAVGRSLPTESTTASGGSYTIPDIIQTDAPINPGNSGGVLLNNQGQLIGVPTAIESTSGSNSGVGFAIPSAIVQKVVPELISSGSFEHPWLGISGTSLTSELAQAMDLSSDQRGALVIDVVSGSPAEDGGLQGSDTPVTISGIQTTVGGDVIVALDDQPVRTFEDLASLLAASQVGQEVSLTVLRQGREETLQVTLGSRPGSTVASGQSQTPGQGETPGTTRSRGRMGIVGTTLTPAMAQAMDLSQDQAGVLVVQVQSGSPAAEAGLRGSSTEVTIDGQQQLVGGDVIVAVDGQEIASMEDLTSALAQAQAGDTLTLTLLRDGREIEREVTLAAAP